jgi:hypothetical protein
MQRFGTSLALTGGLILVFVSSVLAQSPARPPSPADLVLEGGSPRTSS